MDELTGALDTTWARNRATQERRVAVQERAIVALLAGTLDEAGRQVAAGEAHKLAGSLGSFGLDHGSRLAAELETAWSSDEQSPAETARLAGVVAALRLQLGEHNIGEVAEAEHAEPESDGGVDVLLVDDDEVFANFVQDTLRSAACQVSWIADGESARAALCGSSASLRPRLVLLDVEMPGLNGFGLLKELTRCGVTRETAVIMLTRRTMAENIVRARKLGAFDYLAKPLDATVLVERVNRALEVRRGMLVRA